MILPKKCEGSEPGWFVCLLACKEGLDRKEVVRCIKEREIQTRILFARYLIKHQCFDEVKKQEKDLELLDTLKIGMGLCKIPSG